MMKIVIFLVTLLVLSGLAGLSWYWYAAQTDKAQAESIAEKEAVKAALQRQALKMARSQRSEFKKGRRWDIRFNTQGLGLGHSAKYSQHLLSLVLNRTDSAYGRYRLDSAKQISTDIPTAIKLILDKSIDVIVLPSTKQFEEKLKPIRIPICKGLMSYYLIEALPGNDATFEAKALQAATIRINKHNPWRQVLNDHQLTVSANEQADYALHHIASIRDKRQRFNEQHLINIKQAYYFYVHPEAHLLHERIQTGLEHCLYDKSMQRCFDQHWPPIIQSIALDKRNIISLTNKYLPEKTPIDQSHLWHEITY